MSDQLSINETGSWGCHFHRWSTTEPPRRISEALDTIALTITAPDGTETVYAIGTPMETRLQGTLTRGVISASRTLGGYRYIQSDTAVNPGNSGGPLLDDAGQVVAMTVSRYSGDPVDSVQGLNFFIPIDDALRFLALTLEPR